MKVNRLWLSLVALMAYAAVICAAAQRPNVLFIAVDDLRLELGCYGVKEIKTPKIDQFASTAVTFDRAYCQQAVCNPSRVSLLTGLRPDQTKVWYLSTEMRSVSPDLVTIPQHFRQHGYYALGFGKIFHNPWPDNVSWDEPHQWPENAPLWSKEAQENHLQFLAKMRTDGKPEQRVKRIRAVAAEIVDIPDKQHFDGAICEQAIVAMNRLATNKQPFFLAAGFVRPHLPFVVPRKYWDLYDRSKIPLATNAFLPHGAPSLAFGESQGGFYELRDYMDYSEARWPSEGPLSEAQQRELKHGYYASVSFIDAQIGRLLDELNRLGLSENTIVILWGDHGWKLGEHGGWCKQTNYEIDTHAPLIIRAPKAKGNGKHANALVEFVDIYPTLCELTGLPVPKVLQGTSLAPILAKPSAKVKDAAISQFPRSEKGQNYMGYALRTDRYRYIEWLNSTSGEITARELYDHSTDPGENENIAALSKQAALLTKLSAQLWKTIERPKFPFDFSETPAVATAQKSRPSLLWHPTTDQPPPPGKPAGEPQTVTFLNERTGPAEIVWIGPDGTQKTYSTIEQNQTFSIRTRPGAVWLIRDAKGKPLGHFIVEPQSGNTARAVIPKP